MNPFLKQVAIDIYSKHSNNLEYVKIVFPNKRSVVYFRKYLSEIIDKPIWEPQMITINTLFQEQSEYVVADNIILIAELYRAYVDITKYDEVFDEFYFWGEMLLNDFDDIDKNLINTDNIFANIKNLKEIDEFFNPQKQDELKALQNFWTVLSDEKKNTKKFVEFWKILNELYKSFKIRLSEKGIAYEGMLNRAVVDKLTLKAPIDEGCKNIVFVGFNALNQVEHFIFEYFKKQGIADFYWDYDEHFLNNPKHEAGFFIRDNLVKYPQKTQFERDLINSTTKNIELVNSSSDILQAKYIKYWFDNNPAFKNEETAILLADENLLLPVINSIPETLDKINVTMGFSFRNSLAYSFFKNIISLQTRLNEQKKDSYYHKLFINIVSHDFIKSEHLQNIVKELVDKNTIYIKPSFIEAKNDAVLNLIFKKVDTASDLIIYLDLICSQLIDSYSVNGNEKHFITKFSAELNKLKISIQNAQLEKIGIATCFSLINSIMSSISIPFENESAEGVQIMGILETRTLDFKNVLILSMNEGVFPFTVTSNTFIPVSVRFAFGLPTVINQDSIFSYYFYRLVQRTENITLVYNSSTQNNRKGEMSRFIQQMFFETKHKISKTTLDFNYKSSQTEPIIIKKSGAIKEKLDKYFQESTLSYSSLTEYIDCPLKFYFSRIEKLRKPKAIDEKAEANNIGSIFHEVAREVYLEVRDNKALKNNESLKAFNDEAIIENYVYKAFKKVLFKDEDFEYSGQMLVSKHILIKLVKSLIEYDLQHDFEILHLEETEVLEFQLENYKIKFKAILDRVHKVDGQHIIVDYKTGKVDLAYKGIDILFEKDSEINHYIFQMFFYLMVYRKRYGVDASFNLISIEPLINKSYKFDVMQKGLLIDVVSEMPKFEEQLTGLIEKIFNENIAFTQTSRLDICKYCDFKGICNR